MFISFFLELRAAKVPASLREFLTLMEAMRGGVARFDIDDFYFLARTTLVKDERHLDRFDRVFGHCFKGIETPTDPQTELPEEWLRKLAERHLTEEEKKTRRGTQRLGQIDGDAAPTARRTERPASGRQ